MNTVPFGVKRPKNDDFANIVEQERERIQMGEEPRHVPMSKKAKVIWIIGGAILAAVWVILLVLFFSR